MARKRVDTAPQFNVGADSVLIQQVAGSTSTIFEVKNAAGASVMAIDSSGATTATFAAGVGLPVGMITPFAGSTAPTGWFLCGGQEVAIASYGALYAVIGTTYGSLTNGSGGAGTTHFRLPDLRGRVVAGEDDMGGTAASRLTSAVSGVAGTTLGAVGGNQIMHAHSHTNTASFSGTAAAHNHDQNSHGHGISDPSHNHSVPANWGGAYNTVGVQLDPTTYSSPYYYNSTTYNGTGISVVGNTATNIATTTTPAGSVTMTNATFPATAGGSSQNVQPTIVLNYIVRY